MPRRGQPGRRDTRMDGAIDAMGAMGFDEKLVRSTARELLKIYKAGDNGWYFIETDAYKVLIDRLTGEDKEGGENGDAAPQADDAAPQEDDETPLDDAAPLDYDATPHGNDAVPLDNDEAPVDDEALKDNLNGGNETEASAGGPSSTVIQPTNTKMEGCDSSSQTNDTPDAKDCPPVHSLAPPRRRPSYGWMFPDEEEDLVEGTLAPLSELVKLLIRPGHRNSKRKSRWDVKPEDV